MRCYLLWLGAILGEEPAMNGRFANNMCSVQELLAGAVRWRVI